MSGTKVVDSWLRERVKMNKIGIHHFEMEGWVGVRACKRQSLSERIIPSTEYVKLTR